jgi:hypothetical protein
VLPGLWRADREVVDFVASSWSSLREIAHGSTGPARAEADIAATHAKRVMRHFGQTLVVQRPDHNGWSSPQQLAGDGVDLLGEEADGLTWVPAGSSYTAAFSVSVS